MKLRRSRIVLSLYALFIAGSVATVFAVDGVVLIDQTRALAGNVTPGDAPGFPVTITQPGSYRLSGNLNVPADAFGIVIQSDHVTIDLNGFRIAGEGGGLGIATLNNFNVGLPLSGIAVRNGTITHFVTAVLLVSSPDRGAAEVQQIRAIDNSTNGIIVGGPAIITGNIAVGNALGISAGPNATISGNTSSRNSQEGFFVVCPATVVGNAATSNPVPFATLNVGCTFANNTPATP